MKKKSLIKCPKCHISAPCDPKKLKKKKVCTCPKCKKKFKDPTWGLTVTDAGAQWKNDEILNNVNFDITIGCSKAIKNDDYSLSLTNGAKLPIMGKSGTGKSTLMYIIAMLKRPLTGRVEWSLFDDSFGWNYEVKRNFSDFRKKHFSFAFQDNTLLPHLTVKENLVFHLSHLKKEKEKTELTENILNKVLLGNEKNDLAKILHKHPKELSGGQQQRIALAQALITDPTVLFADEPTGSLDLITRKQIMKLMDDWVLNKIYSDQKQRLLIWVTHHADDYQLMNVKYILYVSDNCKIQSVEWLENYYEMKRKRKE